MKLVKLSQQVVHHEFTLLEAQISRELRGLVEYSSWCSKFGDDANEQMLEFLLRAWSGAYHHYYWGCQSQTGQGILKGFSSGTGHLVEYFRAASAGLLDQSNTNLVDQKKSLMQLEGSPGWQSLNWWISQILLEAREWPVISDSSQTLCYGLV